MLPGSHLQIQHARHGVAPRQVLEEDEFFKGEVKDHSKDKEKDKDWYEDIYINTVRGGSAVEGYCIDYGASRSPSSSAGAAGDT